MKHVTNAARVKALLEVAGRGLRAEEIVSILAITWYEWQTVSPELVSSRAIFVIGDGYHNNPYREAS